MSKKIKIYGLGYHEDAIKRVAKKNQYFSDNEKLIEKYHNDSEHVHVFEYVFPDEVKVVFDRDDIKAYIGKNLIGYVSKDGREELEAYFERNNTNKAPLVFQYGKHKIVAPNKEVLDFGEEMDAWVLLDGVEDITALKEANEASTSEEKISTEDRSPFDIVDDKKGSRKARKKAKKKKKFYKRWWFWALVLVVLVVFLADGESAPEGTVEITPKTKVTATPKPSASEKAKETEKPKESEKTEKKVDNGVDPNEWPELAKSGLSKEQIIGIYNDYETAFEDYPEDFDEAEAFEKKVAEDVAKKYNTTPEIADYAYYYATANYDKLVGDGKNSKDELKILYGEFLESHVHGSSIIVKAKIEPNMTNKMTISQNYHNVCDLIQNQGLDKYDEVQYWAVADMTSGDEAKVIQFDVPKDVIKGIKEGNILPTQLGDYVENLWIHPSLKS